jgi:hypothetical protein
MVTSPPTRFGLRPSRSSCCGFAEAARRRLSDKSDELLVSRSAVLEDPDAIKPSAAGFGGRVLANVSSVLFKRDSGSAAYVSSLTQPTKNAIEVVRYSLAFNRTRSFAFSPLVSRGRLRQA